MFILPFHVSDWRKEGRETERDTERDRETETERDLLLELNHIVMKPTSSKICSL